MVTVHKKIHKQTFGVLYPRITSATTPPLFGTFKLCITPPIDQITASTPPPLSAYLDNKNKNTCYFQFGVLLAKLECQSLKQSSLLCIFKHSSFWTAQFYTQRSMGQQYKSSCTQKSISLQNLASPICAMLDVMQLVLQDKVTYSAVPSSHVLFSTIDFSLMLETL